MTEYEIKCPQTWAWYAGFVHDYNESDKKLYIRYPNDWKKPEWIDISSVRYKYSFTASWTPADNEEVECKARAEEHEPYGWWPCKAKHHSSTSSPSKRTRSRSSSSSDPSSDLYSVQFLGWGETHNEILGGDFLRRKSRSALLSARNVTKKRYDVPPSLREWVSSRCESQTILETLMPHKNIASQIIHISFAESTDKLVLIGGRRVLVTMQDIIYCFFEKQKSLLALEKRTEEMERRRDERKQAELAAQKTTFNIHPLLSGYLRGRKNLNIERVQAMRGVIRVDPQYATCYVAAKTSAALREAVDALHIVCRKVVIPNEEMGQIIGYQGKQIQDIKGKSKVIKVISWKMWKEEFSTLKRIQMSRSRDRGYGREMAEGGNGKGTESETDRPRERGVVGFGMTADTMKACDMDNIFGADEVIDLTVGFESEFAPFSDDDRDAAKNETESASAVKTDALVIIGRKSRVEICIFMLEMTLKHFRGIARARNDERKLRREISRLKGTSFTEYGRGGRMGGRGRRGGRGMDRRRGGRGGGRDNRRYDRRDGGNNDRRRDGRDNDRRRNDRDRNRGDRDRQARNANRDAAADDQKDGSQQSNERRGDRGNNNNSNNNNRDGRDGRDNRRRNDRNDRNDRNERGQGQRDGGGGGGGQRERYRKKEQQGQGGQGGGGQHDEKAEALGAPVRDVRVVEAEQAEAEQRPKQGQSQGQGQDGAQTQGAGSRKRRRGGRKRGAAQQQQQPQQQQQQQQQPSKE